MIINLNDCTPINIPAITSGTSAQLIEACSLLLQQNYHEPGVILSIFGDYRDEFEVYWDRSNELYTSYEPKDAIEFGAMCLALLIIPKLTNLVPKQRAYQGSESGFDYWLCTREKIDLYTYINGDDLENIFDKRNYDGRLEISGIFQGTSAEINSRAKIKIDQTMKSDFLNLPAYILIIEFSKPTTKAVARL